MKKLIIFLLMMLPLGVFAQESKIAIVNTQEVIQAMPEFATMQKQMADMEAKYKNEMQVMNDEYTKKYSDFIAQQDSLTENIKMRRMQELEDMQQRTQNFIQISRQDFDKHIHFREFIQDIRILIRNRVNCLRQFRTS